MLKTRCGSPAGMAVILFLSMLLPRGQAHAASTLFFQFSGTASGYFNGVFFTDRAFTFSATAQSALIEPFTTGGMSGYLLMNDIANISVDGLGYGDITLNQTYTVVNNTLGTVAFSVTNPYVYDPSQRIDIYVSSPDPTFAQWNLGTPLGPVAGNWTISWGAANIVTPQAGGVYFDDDSSVPGSFRAVPVPAAAWLVAPAIGLLAPRVKRRQHRRALSAPHSPGWVS